MSNEEPPHGRPRWVIWLRRTLFAASAIAWAFALAMGYLAATFGGLGGTLPPESALPKLQGMHRVGDTYCAGDPLCGGLGAHLAFDTPAPADLAARPTAADTSPPPEVDWARKSLQRDGWVANGPFRLAKGDFVVEIYSQNPRPANEHASISLEIYFASQQIESKYSRRHTRALRRHYTPHVVGLGVLTIGTVCVAIAGRQSRAQRDNETPQQRGS